jgi:hypothetical protein
MWPFRKRQRVKRVVFVEDDNGNETLIGTMFLIHEDANEFWMMTGIRADLF